MQVRLPSLFWIAFLRVIKRIDILFSSRFRRIWNFRQSMFSIHTKSISFELAHVSLNSNKEAIDSNCSEKHRWGAHFGVAITMLLFLAASNVNPGKVTKNNVDLIKKTFPYDNMIYVPKKCKTCGIDRYIHWKFGSFVLLNVTFTNLSIPMRKQTLLKAIFRQTSRFIFFPLIISLLFFALLIAKR